MLQTRALAYTYTSGQPLQFPNLDCARGSQWLLLGESGQGKTTLLHLLAGLLKPTSGDVLVDEQSLTQLPAAQIDRLRGQSIGLVFQRPHFIRALSVANNLLVAQSMAGLKTDQAEALNLLKKLGLEKHKHKKPHRLSAGEQQRLAIARALINKPSVILADEPTSSLDDTNTERVIQLLKDNAAETGATLLIVTHDQRLKNNFPKQLHL